MVTHGATALLWAPLTWLSSRSPASLRPAAPSRSACRSPCCGRPPQRAADLAQVSGENQPSHRTAIVSWGPLPKRRFETTKQIPYNWSIQNWILYKLQELAWLFKPMFKYLSCEGPNWRISEADTAWTILHLQLSYPRWCAPLKSWFINYNPIK